MAPLWAHAREELDWLAFFLPRQAVQLLARYLPLAALRDRLPPAVAARLRQSLYGARLSEAPTIACERRCPAWGDPAELDPTQPIRFDMPPRASVLIVTYNNLALTRLCLASLQRAAGSLPFEILVVDNASRDGTIEYLRTVEESALLPFRVLCNPDNRGFAAANNQAASLARGEVLVLLNNDTVVTPGWLDRLVDHLAKNPGIGQIGPVTNSCGNEAELECSYTTLGEMAPFASSYTEAHAGQLANLPMLTLFCAALGRDLFERIGGLDERYRVGMFEDDDLSLAIQSRGLRCVAAHDVFVHHYGRASFSRLAPREYLRLFWENRRRFERKWQQRWVPR